MIWIKESKLGFLLKEKWGHFGTGFRNGYRKKIFGNRCSMFLYIKSSLWNKTTLSDCTEWSEDSWNKILPKSHVCFKEDSWNISKWRADGTFWHVLEVQTDKMQHGWWCLKSKQDLGFHFEYHKVRSTTYCINGGYSSIKWKPHLEQSLQPWFRTLGRLI